MVMTHLSALPRSSAQCRVGAPETLPQSGGLFVFEHDHNFHQLFGKLAGQTGLKGIC
jgi:hypothetical protein